MALVPEEMLDKFERKQKLETSPIISNLLQSDKRMSDILERSDLGDDEKQKLYNMDMQRFLELRQQKNSQVPTVRFAPNIQEGNEATPLEPLEAQLPQSSEDDIVANLPKTHRTRAIRLLNRLKARPDVITWDDTGQVKIDGETIPNSNITDLVSDAMRSRKNFNPVGSRVFFQALSKLNVPKDLVRNDDRWKQVGETNSTQTRRSGGFGRPSRTGGFGSPRTGGFGSPRTGGFGSPRTGDFGSPPSTSSFQPREERRVQEQWINY
jgi:hypothetical protein